MVGNTLDGERATSPQTAEGSIDVAQALEQLRAGLRQRQAELATVDEELRRLPPTLAKLHEIQYVDVPQATSHRPGIGRLIVLAKSLVYKAFMKWVLSSVVEQQNAFNRATAQAMSELFERQKRLAAETRRLAEELEALTSRRPGGGS